MAYYGRPTRRTNIDVSGGGTYDMGSGALAGLQAAGSMQAPEYAANLARGAGLQSAAQQQDFANQYFGSQIAPQWTSTLQAMAGHRLRGGPSPTGSTQLTGESVQPDYLTTGATFRGRPNPAGLGTMFSPGQQSAVTGLTYEQQQALKGLLGQ